MAGSDGKRIFAVLREVDVEQNKHEANAVASEYVLYISCIH